MFGRVCFIPYGSQVYSKKESFPCQNVQKNGEKTLFSLFLLLHFILMWEGVVSTILFRWHLSIAKKFAKRIIGLPLHNYYYNRRSLLRPECFEMKTNVLRV